MSLEFCVQSIYNNETLSKGSKQSYIARLNQLFSMLGLTDINEILTAPEQFKIIIDDKYPNVFTRKTFLDIPIYFLMHEKDKVNITRSGKFNEILIEYKNAIQQHYDKSAPSETKKGSLMKSTELMDIKLALPLGSFSRMLISCYIDIPPVRNDFYLMRVCKDLDEYYKFCETDSNEVNYIIFKECVMYMFSYKGSNTKGTYDIPLNPTFLYEVNQYLIHRPCQKVQEDGGIFLFTKDNGSLFPSAQSFCNKANYALKKATLNDKFSLVTFRHIACSEINDKTLGENRELAHGMGNSVATQNLYNWTPSSQPPAYKTHPI